MEWSLYTEDYSFRYAGTGRYDFIEFNEDEGAPSFYDADTANRSRAASGAPMPSGAS